jgi:hypothetical protein
MAKSIKSIYFESDLMLKAEEKNLNLNFLCNEALRLALNDKSNTGQAINDAAEQAKDNQTMLRIKMIKGSMGREKWQKAVIMYGQKYDLTIDEVIKKFSK